MPTNVPPAYRSAEARYREAKTAEEKLAALEEMLRIMPKHKGTDKLQADVKARIAKLRSAQEKKGGSKGHGHAVPREGAGQVALLGPPNSGKSSLLLRLTHAEPKVDLPPVSAQHTEPWVFDLARRAEQWWIVLEAESAREGWEETRRLLEEKHLVPRAPGTPAPDAPLPTTRPTLVVITGLDRPDGASNLAAFRELGEAPLPLFGVSATEGRGLDDLRRAAFLALDVIRVFTKEPGKPPDRSRPFVLPRGGRVEDLARQIHNDLARRLKFARLWGRSVFDGQPVQRDHVLEEGDVVEIHEH
jgi:hypothetical protein